MSLSSNIDLMTNKVNAVNTCAELQKVNAAIQKQITKITAHIENMGTASIKLASLSSAPLASSFISSESVLKATQITADLLTLGEKVDALATAISNKASNLGCP